MVGTCLPVYHGGYPSPVYASLYTISRCTRLPASLCTSGVHTGEHELCHGNNTFSQDVEEARPCGEERPPFSLRNKPS